MLFISLVFVCGSLEAAPPGSGALGSPSGGNRAASRESALESRVQIAVRAASGEKGLRGTWGGHTFRAGKFGSGFAVAPGRFVTNRHVIESLLKKPGLTPQYGITSWAEDPPLDGTARLLAVSKDGDVDLAVLEAVEARLRGIPWSPVRCDLPGSGRQYAVAATAAVPAYRDGKKTGSAFALPMNRLIHIVSTITNPGFQKMILFEPETMQGNSGAPILDIAPPFGSFKEGVLGVVVANRARVYGPIVVPEGVGQAIPGSVVVDFLKMNHIPHIAINCE